MQMLKSFSPKKYASEIIETYSVCPSIFTLSQLCNRDGYSEITCTVANSRELVTLFVVQQKQRVFSANRDGIGTQYLLTAVAPAMGRQPSFWLVTCAVSLYGYLLPIEAFDEADIKAIETIPHYEMDEVFDIFDD